MDLFVRIVYPGIVDVCGWSEVDLWLVCLEVCPDSCCTAVGMSGWRRLEKIL